MNTNEDEVAPSTASHAKFRRKRQLKDLLDQAVLYSKNGLLSKLPSTHEYYLSSAAEEFSVVSGIPICGAKRVLSLMKIQENQELCQYLSEHTLLRVFHASELAKGNRTIQSAGGTMDIDLIRLLVADEEENPPDPMKRKMAAVLSQFQPQARQLLVLICFKLFGVISTLSGWIDGDPFTAEELGNILQRLHSDTWNTPAMWDQCGTAFSRKNMTSGWTLVNEVMKVQVQEMHWSFLSKFNHRRGEERKSLRDEDLITTRDVEGEMVTCCEFVLREFCAWIYSLGLFRDGDDESSSRVFVDKMSTHFDRLFVGILREIQPASKHIHEQPSVPHFDRTVLKELLSRIDEGEPAMADVKYDLGRMVPYLRRNRRSSSSNAPNLETLLCRCRRRGSRVVEIARGLPHMEAGREGDNSDDGSEDEIEISTAGDSDAAIEERSKSHSHKPRLPTQKEKLNDSGAVTVADALMGDEEQVSGVADLMGGTDEMALSPARKIDDERTPTYPAWLREFGPFIPTPEPRIRRQDPPLGQDAVRTTRAFFQENALSRIRGSQPVRDVNYAAELVDSDNEFIVQTYPREQKSTSLGDRAMSRDLEDFFAEMLSWTIHPGHHEEKYCHL